MKNMKTLFLLLLLLPATWIQPVIAQKFSREEKAAQTEKAFQEMKELVASKHFKITIDRVYPQSGHDVNRFNPTGKIIIQDSIAEGNLPFFGRAYSLPYGEGGGIEFNAPMKDSSVKIIEKRKKKSVIFGFSVPGQNDLYQFQIDIAPGGGCSINLSSNNRTHISYSGSLSPLEKE